MSDEDDETDRIDEAAKKVAAHLPFPVDLTADMGGTFALQIELGRRDGPDGEPDRATLDPGDGEVWIFETGGGAESSTSTFGVDADPADVARWIAAEAARHGSPAALTAASSSSDFPKPAAHALSAERDTYRPTTTGRHTDRGQDLSR